ncbi:MAG: DUF4157 domain-containing protein, partial [Pseudomonadota bacterium]
MKTTAAKTPKPQAADARKPKPRWSVVVDNTKAENTPEGQAQDITPFIPLDRLQEAANLTPGPLPHRAELEAQFGQDLSGLKAVQGPQVDAALEAKDAEAAVSGDVIYLKPATRPAIIAHEVAHMLQKHGFQPVDPVGAEAEAREAEARVDAGRPIQPLEAGLAPTDIALRATGDLAPSERRSAQSPEDAFRQEAPGQAAPASPSNDAQTEATPGDPAETTSTDGVALEETTLPADVDENPVPTFELPPEPEIEVDEAAAEAAQAEAEAALEGAEDADGLMGALKDAPPSVKARKQGELEGETDRLSASEQASFDEDMPNFDAEMSGEDDLEAPAPVAAPEGGEAVLEDGTPAPAPEPELDPTPEPEAADLNENFAQILNSLFGFGDAGGLGKAFDRVNTSDTDVDTSAGQRPDVPLEGETDPERVANQDEAARDEAKLKRAEATQGVLDGPGPEQAQLKEMSEEFTAEARAAPEIEQTGEVAEGAEEFAQKELDPEVTALFDAHHHETMSASLTQAQSEMDTAVADRDTERDAEVENAEAERDRLNEEANQSQRDEVTARRQDIQDARQQAVDDQASHVSDLESETESARADAQSEIDEEVRSTEEEVSTSFDEAEAEAQDEVDEGYRQAEERRAQEERNAENDSWWDRATDWVEEQFDRLTSFINDIFDAVRSAVSAIIDAVKEAAVALIDAAANAIKAAIEVFGELAKGLVNTLLAEHFPAVAAVLNATIDVGVELAQRAVDAVADVLKAGITALLDALAAGLDAILAAFQAAVNTALAIARAALTGDWQALARLVLEPILMALGIQPEAFYQMIARAEESLGIIIDDPLGFLSNLVDSVTGGIRYFADNFLTHLQAGIIAWLTGALGSGITLPERWDLWGVLDLARQILGLTVDMIRRVAVRILGEQAVERIEFFMGYAVELITGGWSALWERIQADLGQLKDMVLDQIKTFLVERVVMASIMWLASLFNPVGALVKLVMTIWNFVMFLKDQLARIIQVVQTVVNTMWEIATGVLEPAMRGVEGVLANLLPVAIDLLARLLGLGNVSGRVQRIIADIRQSIEDAIVRLIQRVLARFTGRGRGGAGDGEDGPDGAPDEIMAPVRIRGGGESHTLTIDDQGETVVPMIRSTPMTLETWLDGRLGDPFTQLARDNGWEGTTRTEKYNALDALVTQAKAEESQLDAKAEEAEDSVDEGNDTDATPAEVAEAQADVQAVAAQAQETKSALEQVLEFFGLTEVDLTEKFSDEIAQVPSGALRDQFVANVIRRLDSRIYGTLTWAEAKPMLMGYGAIANAWKRPLVSDGIVQRVFETAYKDQVKAIIHRSKPGVLDNDTDGSVLDEFLARNLSRLVNTDTIKRTILEIMISSNASGAAVADALETAVDAGKAALDTVWDKAGELLVNVRDAALDVLGRAREVRDAALEDF